MVDMTEHIAPDSTQITAESLIDGPVILQIKEVKDTGEKSKPYAIFFHGQRWPWLPCKISRRTLIETWGRADARKCGSTYPGRWLRLWRDPSVMFKGVKVGGVRHNGASYISGTVQAPVYVGQGRTVVFPIERITPPDQQASEIVGWSSEEEERFTAALDGLNADLPGVEQWCAANNWPRPALMDETKRAGLLNHLRAPAGQDSYHDCTNK